MDYKLAKQLFGNKFPYKQNWKAYDMAYVVGKELFPIPPLSELIEACGDGLSTLYKYDDGSWCATSDNVNDSDWKLSLNRECVGETPEEAVAKLWLRLSPASLSKN